MKKVLFPICALCLLVIAASFAPVLHPRAVFAREEAPQVKSSILIDVYSGEVLTGENEEAHLPVASVVKLMTILLTLEQIDSGKLNLDDKFTASSSAAGMGGSQVFIDAGTSYKIEDMLKSVIVASANDASVLLAEAISGSEEYFVELMNKRADELNLSNTHFENCTGLPSNGYSCAKDVAVMLKEVVCHDKYFNYSTIWMDKLIHKNNRETELVNTNKLIRYLEGCDGGKTGSTNEAGYCLAATVKRGDMRLIGVVLGAKTAKDRFAACSNLLNYGFATYENKVLVKAGDVLKTIAVNGGKTRTLNIGVNKDITKLTAKNSTISFTTSIEAADSVKAPVALGDIIGKIYIMKDGVVVDELPLAALENITCATIADNISHIISKWAI